MKFTTFSDKNRIYFDHNATTPPAEFLREKILEWAEAWGNSSSIHWAGRKPKTLLRESRAKVARMIGCDPLEVIFTSGGTEANNLCLKGIFETLQKPPSFTKKFRNHYLLSSVEHPSLMRTAEYLASRGARVEFIPVCKSGEIDLIAFENMVTEETALVSVMLANNETGNVFPVKKMAKIAHAKGALFHTDAVQALGKMPLNVRDLDVDLATFSGHKFYALKGSGVLYVRKGVQLESLIHGGGQERHRRGGTENVLAIASLGAMAELASEVIPRAQVLTELRDEMEKRLLAEIPALRLTGAEGKRLPGTSSMVIPGVDGETLLMNLDMKGFAVSTGAACSSGSPEPSPVLLAMGLSREEAQSSLRVGLGWGTTKEEVELFISTLKEVVAHLRTIASQGGFETDFERPAHASI